MKWTADSKRTWIVAGLMALLALGLAPGGTRAERERVQARAEGGEFYGVVTSIPGTAGWIGDWTVDGRTVRVDPSTRIEQEHGQPAVGASIEVKGQAQADGSLKATKIEVKGMSARGEPS